MDLSTLLYVDLETGFVGETDGVGFERFTERHYREIAPRRGDPMHTPHSIYKFDLRPIVVALHGGLPSREELAYSATALADRRPLFYHWPAENVVEVVTAERLASFRRHVRFVAAYWSWRAFRRGLAVNTADLKLRARAHARRIRGGVARGVAPAAALAAAPAAAAASVAALRRKPRQARTGPPDPTRFAFLKEVDGRLVAEGRGLYVRLDYWSKIKGGGSYGHTVYQARALEKASRLPLVCAVTQNFDLLSHYGVHQVVLPSTVALSDEHTIVEAGEAYADLIRALIDFYRPAFVFERMVLGSAVAARAAADAGVPYIAEYNGSELTMSKLFGGREMANAGTLLAIENEAFALADVVSVVSAPVKDAIVEHGVAAEKVLVNPNAVDLDAYGPAPAAERAALRAGLGFSADDVVLGFCGTFGGWHGIEVLAEAMPKIAAARPAARFLLIGDGGFKHLVREAVAAAGIGGRVRDVGMTPQREAARLLAACDIFLSPHSRNMGDKPFFGSPTKLFEYMAYGAGIVCSDLVQLGEVMRPAVLVGAPADEPQGARSVLVAPGSADDLVAAALLLVDDPALRRRLGENARAAAEKYYTWDAHVQALWRFALGRPPGGYHEDRGVR